MIKVFRGLNGDQQMDNLQTPGRGWAKQVLKLKILFPELEDEDFCYAYGKKEEMMYKLQRKIGVTRPDLNELISDAKYKEKKTYR
jgi:hypothetical protein